MFKNPIIGLVLSICLFGLIWEATSLYLISPKTVLGEIGKDFIYNIIKFLLIIIPVIFTFFYFAYKEQKSLSVSSPFEKLNFISILMVSFLVVFGLGIYITYSPHNQQVHDNRAYIWFIVFILTIGVFLCGIVRQIWLLNITNLIQTTIKKIKFEMENSTTLPKRSKVLKKIYKVIENDVSSYYQMLFFTLEKNMFDVYRSSILEWEKVLLFDIQQRSPFKRFKWLLEMKLTEGFISLYTCIAKNQILLITKLIQINRIEEANYAINLFTKLLPLDDELKRCFYTAFHELAVVSYKLEMLDFILEELNLAIEVESNSSKSIESSVYEIYEKLMILALEKKDLNAISKISYSMIKEPIKNEEENLELEIPDPIETKRSNNSFYTTIYMLFQASVKSVELSYYSITGFLIKFMVTNFSTEHINDVYGKFIRIMLEEKQHSNPYTLNHSSITSTFNINMHTLNYCFEKMSILLYGQQLYAYENKIQINKNVKFDKQPINIEPIFQLTYTRYLLAKIKKSSDNYGLIFLTNDQFFEQIEKDFLDPVEEIPVNN